MNGRPIPYWTGQSFAIILTVAAVFCAAPVVQGAEDATFEVVEKDGAKVWQGGGTVDLKARGSNPLRFKVMNKLSAEHGFTIYTMKIQEVLRPGEQKTIVVPRENIDMTVATHRVYCHLHPKHVAATLQVVGP